MSEKGLKGIEMMCEYCKQPIAPENAVRHHTSYNPEVMVLVHRVCHVKLHTEYSHPLKPNEKRSALFKYVPTKGQMNVYISEEQLGRFREWCAAQGRPMNRVMVKMIDDLLENRYKPYG